MYFYEFQGVRIAGLACAVPDYQENIMDYAGQFPAGEIEKFCETTGIRKRYNSNKHRTTTADLGVAAANHIFEELKIDRNTIDGIIFITQTPDYMIPPTSCVIQHRLGLNDCGIVLDSNIGCTAFPYGVQMACANLMAGCNRILLMVGDAEPWRGKTATKDSLLFGDAAIAAVLEKTEEAVSPIHVCIDTIGSGYKALLGPYGMYRHPLYNLYAERGIEYALAYNNFAIMQGSDVFTFSIKDAPKATKAFYEHFGCCADDYDLISIHQANKLIVDNVAKRIKAPSDKVQISLNRFANTRGASTAVNICDYAEQNECFVGKQKILNVAFGVGLNIVVLDFEMDMSKCLPIVKTTEAYDDGITNFTYF